MFRLVMGDAKNMKNIVEAIVNIIDEGPLEVNEEGIVLRAIDPSQIAMILLNIPKTAFKEFSIESPTVLGVNYAQLSKVLARAHQTDKLILSGNESTLSVEFIGENTHRTFKMPLLESRELIRKELTVDPEATLTVDSSQLKDALKDATLVSTYFTFIVDEDNFILDVKGDGGNLKTEINKEALRKAEVKNKCRASFSLQYMDNIVKACPSHNTISLYIRTDMPLKTEYKIGEANIVYFLAPRKEEYE